MSIKSTRRITRKQAISVLLSEIPWLSNDALGELMDTLADTEQSKTCSRFDNFIISDVEERRNDI